MWETRIPAQNVKLYKEQCERWICFHSCTEPSVMSTNTLKYSSVTFTSSEESLIKSTRMYWPYRHCFVESCCCCCCPNEFVFGFNCSREWAQISSLGLLRSAPPCWPHMETLIRQLGLHIQNMLLCVQQGCLDNRENKLRAMAWKSLVGRVWSVWVEPLQRYCLCF